MEATVVKEDTLKDGKSAERANPREEALKRIRKMAKERADLFLAKRGAKP